MRKMTSHSVLRRRLMAAGLLAAASPAWPLTDEEGGLYEKIRASGSLKIAIYKDNAPFSEETGNEPAGLDVDIGRALAASLGLSASFLPFRAGEDMVADLRWMVEKGHYLGFGPADMMMRVPVDKQLMFANRKVIIFAPYMSERPVLVRDTRQLEPVALPEDLVGKAIAAETGAGLTSVLMLQANGQLKPYVRLHPTGIAAARAVIDGEAAAAYTTRSQAETALRQAGGASRFIQLDELSLSHMAAKGWPVGIAVLAANRRLRMDLEEGMAKIRASGELLKIFQTHGLTLTTP